MPRKFYSDKYLKHKRDGKMAEDEMLRGKAMADEARSERKEAQRQMRRQEEDENWPEVAAKKEPWHQ